MRAGDLARMAAAVLREGARTFGDRAGLTASARSGLPRSPARLDPVWLSAELAGASPGVEVRAVRVLDGHSGTTARARIALDYASKGSGLPLPDRMFAKFAPTHFATALFGAAMRLGRNEVRFYRELAHELPVPVPAVYLARATPNAERFLLLLEDLAESGWSFATLATPCTAERARAVVASLARLHARYFASPRLDDDLAWLPRRGADPPYPIGRALCDFAVKPALSRYGELLSRDLRRAAPEIGARREALEDAWAVGPLTLIHGDPHIGNLYFRGAGEVGFLDWQLPRCAQGVRDVAHFVVSSLDVPLRRECEAELLVHYCDTLARCGVEDFSLDEVRRQFRLHTFYEWLSATVTAAASTFQPEEVVVVALERMSAAIEDWDALDALQSL